MYFVFFVCISEQTAIIPLRVMTSMVYTTETEVRLLRSTNWRFIDTIPVNFCLLCIKQHAKFVWNNILQTSFIFVIVTDDQQDAIVFIYLFIYS